MSEKITFNKFIEDIKKQTSRQNTIQYIQQNFGTIVNFFIDKNSNINFDNLNILKNSEVKFTNDIKNALYSKIVDMKLLPTLKVNEYRTNDDGEKTQEEIDIEQQEKLQKFNKYIDGFDTEEEKLLFIFHTLKACLVGGKNYKYLATDVCKIFFTLIENIDTSKTNSVLKEYFEFSNYALDTFIMSFVNLAEHDLEVNNSLQKFTNFMNIFINSINILEENIKITNLKMHKGTFDNLKKEPTARFKLMFNDLINRLDTNKKLNIQTCNIILNELKEVSEDLYEYVHQRIKNKITDIDNLIIKYSEEEKTFEQFRELFKEETEVSVEEKTEERTEEKTNIKEEVQQKSEEKTKQEQVKKTKKKHSKFRKFLNFFKSLNLFKKKHKKNKKNEQIIETIKENKQLLKTEELMKKIENEVDISMNASSRLH